jgi:hypothetical protein
MILIAARDRVRDRDNQTHQRRWGRHDRVRWPPARSTAMIANASSTRSTRIAHLLCAGISRQGEG